MKKEAISEREAERKGFFETPRWYYGSDGVDYACQAIQWDEDGEILAECSLTRRVVTARKASVATRMNLEIKVGDRVSIIKGVEYECGGPRIGYYHRRSRASKGPAWAAAN